jgi:transcription antitermination factor NusA-like protein
MIPEPITDIAVRIGKFYLNKNNSDYKKTEQEVISLRIQNIALVEDKIHITTFQPGILIGKRGENIGKLQEWLGKKIHVIEAEDDLLYYLIPCHWE